jgi:hypothetical protein
MWSSGAGSDARLDAEAARKETVLAAACSWIRRRLERERENG